MSKTALSDEELQSLYTWVDSVPLSRPKRNISRDFSDGVLLAEIVHHFFPRLVSIHNYESTNAVSSKLYNLRTLQEKVLKRLRFSVDEKELAEIAESKQGAVELLLFRLRRRIEQSQVKRREGSGRRRRRKEDGRRTRASVAESSPPPSVPKNLRAQKQRRALKSRDESPTTTVGWSSSSPSGNSHARRVGHHPHAELRASVEQDLLLEKEKTIRDLRETIETLELKVEKMNQLLRLKNAMVDQLRQKLDQSNT